MKPEHVKKLLLTEIKNVADNPQDYCFNPDNDFTRKRKLSMEKVLAGIIGMERGSLTNELLDLFDASADTPTASAFIQQRNKIRPEAFESIFAGFSHKLMTEFTENMPILAVDGSDVQIPTNPEDLASFYSETNNRFLSAQIYLQLLKRRFVKNHLIRIFILYPCHSAPCDSPQACDRNIHVRPFL